MRIISAYMMAVLGGNAAPAKADIVAILDAIGSDTGAIDAQIDAFLASIEGKDVAKLVEAGLVKVGKFGGGGAAAAGPAGDAPAAEAAKEEESEEESSAGGLGGMF